MAESGMKKHSDIVSAVQRLFPGLKDTYSERNLEDAILQEMALFIMEPGQGFTFVERRVSEAEPWFGFSRMDSLCAEVLQKKCLEL